MKNRRAMLLRVLTHIPSWEGSFLPAIKRRIGCKEVTEPGREEANDIFYSIKDALCLYKSLWALANTAWASGCGATELRRWSNVLMLLPATNRHETQAHLHAPGMYSVKFFAHLKAKGFRTHLIQLGIPRAQQCPEHRRDAINAFPLQVCALCPRHGLS